MSLDLGGGAYFLFNQPTNQCGGVTYNYSLRYKFTVDTGDNCYINDYYGFAASSSDGVVGQWNLLQGTRFSLGDDYVSFSAACHDGYSNTLSVDSITLTPLLD